MKIGCDFLFRRLILLIAATILLRRLDSASAVCEFSIVERNKLYNYSLASPNPKFPHGALSEDGFYKVESNGTVLWFQLCDAMIFNHDPPRCVDCGDCGGSSHCGVRCSALVANNVGGVQLHKNGDAFVVSMFLQLGMLGLSSFGTASIYTSYHVCTTIGRTLSMTTDLLDKSSPHIGVTVRMSNTGPKLNCSLSVSVICDPKEFQGPQTLERVGICDYATQIRHPSGCAKIVSTHGNGWGWFATLMIMVFCLFGVYLLAGAGYRYYLGVRGIDVIPNLELWASLPHRAQNFYSSLVRRFRGPSESYRSSYSPVNF